jgi:RsiW-degrading membrane proteinase PrsW (M82 family)
MRNRYRSVSESALIEIVGIAIFAALVALVAEFVRPQLSGASLILVGIVLAIVPAALWLVAFYRQDLEPEPKQYVLGVFVLGAVLAQAIGQPVVRDLFHVQEWGTRDMLLGFLASILIVGVVQEFLKYAAVRYTVFGSAEFDQPVDGIIYGASAGLGYATMLNIWYVISNGGVDLGVGAVRCAVEALAQASTAGVVGYFLGQAKFRRMGPLWLPAGIVLAAALNATVNLLLDQAPLFGTFGFNIWAALIAAVVVAGVIFGALLTIIKRLNATTVAAATQSEI